MHDHYNICEMSQLVLDGMAKGPELLQQLLHRGIENRTLSLPTLDNTHGQGLLMLPIMAILYHYKLSMLE